MCWIQIYLVFISKARKTQKQNILESWQFTILEIQTSWRHVLHRLLQNVLDE